MCQKVVYLNKAEAKKVAFEMSRKTGTLIRPYKCPLCGNWNIGHKCRAAKRAELRELARSLYGTE